MNTRMQRLLFFLLPLLFVNLSQAQYEKGELDKILSTYSNEQLLKESGVLLEEGYYFTAEKLIDKLLASDANNANYNYRKGFIKSQGYGNFAASIPYLEKAVPYVSKKYDAASGKETNSHTDCHYFLAQAYHRTNQLDAAEKQYKAYMAVANNKTDNYQYAVAAISQIETGRKLLMNPKRNVEVKNIGTNVNSTHPDYSPVVSLDGSSLFFTSRRPWDANTENDNYDPQTNLFPEDVYVSYRNADKTWSTPTRLDFCDRQQNEASVSISSSDKRIYVYQDKYGNGNLFYSELKNNRFKKIESFDNGSINTEEYWETHGYLTPDGRTFYFTSNRDGGFGGRDIYRIVKLADGTWSQPFNMGPTINTEYDEESPFMSVDNKMLYFASNGPKSMGGFDIFVTFVDEDNNWSEPVNLGYPINSFDDDLFYTETTDGRRGYITSRRADSNGDKDIYEIKNDYFGNRGYLLNGKIVTTNGDPLPEDVVISVVCKDCSNEEPLSTYPRVEEGTFVMDLDGCHDYEIQVTRDNGEKIVYQEAFNTSCEMVFQEIYKEYKIDPNTNKVTPLKDTNIIVNPIDTAVVPSFEPLALKHNFIYNGSVLSLKEGKLKSFVQGIEHQLDKGKTAMVIEVYSSASTVPTQTYKTNEKLAKVRADRIKKTLDDYFASSKYKNKVEVKIVETVVSGPSYQGDKENTAKYEPFQFISLKTK